MIRPIGSGGFGQVWLCRTEALGDFRALKWIPAANPDHLDKECHSLLLFRSVAGKLRSPHVVPIEHINRHENGFYYVMPLADGTTPADPGDRAWGRGKVSGEIRCHDVGQMPTGKRGGRNQVLMGSGCKPLRLLIQSIVEPMRINSMRRNHRGRLEGDERQR